MAEKKESHEDIKRLYRSRYDKILAGVCGGIGEYLNIDPVWVRLIAVLMIFADGAGILAYIIAWILIPENPNQGESKKTVAEDTAEKVRHRFSEKMEARMERRRHKDSRDSVLIGVIIVLIGTVFLFRNMFNWFQFRFIWPLAIVLMGLYLIVRRS
jgi:phage shock protein C